MTKKELYDVYLLLSGQNLKTPSSKNSHWWSMINLQFMMNKILCPKLATGLNINNSQVRKKIQMFKQLIMYKVRGKN